MKDWPIEGPRSALWCIRFLDDSGRGGLEPYHKWWRTTCKLSLADWGVANHMQMMRFLSLAGVYDHLGLSNLAVIEAIAMRAELIEYQYRERAREGLQAAGLGTGASSSLTGAAVLGGEEADLFDGVGKIAGGAMVAPMIVDFVAHELEKKATIHKQAWKAREDNAVLRNTRQPVDDPNAPSPADDGDDDRAVLVDLVGGLDYKEQSAKFIGLEENLLSLPPEGAEPKPLPGPLWLTREDDVRHFINTAVLPARKQASHLSAASAPPVFIDQGCHEIGDVLHAS